MDAPSIDFGYGIMSRIGTRPNRIHDPAIESEEYREQLRSRMQEITDFVSLYFERTSMQGVTATVENLTSQVRVYLEGPGIEQHLPAIIKEFGRPQFATGSVHGFISRARKR